MADSKPTHKVVRNGFYRRFGGKLMALKRGTEMTLSAEQGEKLVKRGFVKAIEPDKPKAKPEPKPEPEKAKPDKEPEEEAEKPKKKKKKSKG